MTDDRCSVCGKGSNISHGWYFAHDLNFCSNRCVARYIEAIQRSKSPQMKFCWDCGAEGTEEEFAHYGGCAGRKAKI